MGFHFPNPGQIIHDIENAAHHAADAARHGIEDAGHNAIGGIQNLEHEATGRLNQIAHDAEGKLNGVAHDLEGGIKSAAHDAQGELQSAGNALKSDIDAAGRAAVHSAEQAVETALSEAFQAAAKAAAAKFVKMVRRFQPAEARLVLGPFTLHFEKPVDKIVHVVEFAEHPSATRDDLKKLIEAIAPTSIDADFGVEVPVIEMGVGGGITVDVEAFIEGIDDTLDDLGI